MYTREGIRSVNEMKRLLNITLINDVFKDEKLPDSFNKIFFPVK